MQNQKLKEIEKHIETFKELVYDADTVSRTEFIAAFKQVTDGFQALKQNNLKEVESLRSITANEAQKLSDRLNEAVDGALKKIEAATAKAIKEQQSGMNFIHDRVKRMESGKDKDEERMIEKLSDLSVNYLEKRIPTIEEIRNNFEYLEDDERLSLKAIAGLSELIEDVKKLKNRPAAVGSAAGVGTIFVELTATGDIDGTNADFVFSQKPKYINVNGSMYREGKGWSWTASTSTVTLDFNPPTDSDVFGVL